ncbi:MAG: FkbM family methyltransferase, partial [Candidatus Omnitrophota bacterium]
CYMIEPSEHNLKCGEENFKLNNMKGIFVKGVVGQDNMRIDDFIRERRIETIHILHADIEGRELEMLRSCEEVIKKNKIWYFFISTHSQKLHYECISFLKKHGFVIIASADFEYETYSYDGVLVARSGKIKGADPIKIHVRRKSQ